MSIPVEKTQAIKPRNGIHLYGEGVAQMVECRTRNSVTSLSRVRTSSGAHEQFVRDFFKTDFLADVFCWSVEQ